MLVTGNLLKKKFNVTVPVTMFKHLFNGTKTVHLDRLCRENSFKESRANLVDYLSVCCKRIILRLSKHKCFVTNNVQRRQK